MKRNNIIFASALLYEFMNIRKIVLAILLPLFWMAAANAQDVQTAKTDGEDIIVDYDNPKTYVVGGVDVRGVKFIGKKQIIALSGLKVGMSVTVPSDELSEMVNRIWKQSFFSEVVLRIDSLSAKKDTAYFCFEFQERPKVSSWKMIGVKNSERKDLQDLLRLRRNTPLSDYLIRSSKKTIEDYYKEKGYYNVDVKVLQQKDSMIRNAVLVTFDIVKGKKVKVKKINFFGNDHVSDNKIISSMSKIRDMRFRNIFRSKKFNEKDYENDKVSMLQAFHEFGYRDAKLVKDSIYVIKEGRLGIDFTIDEGKQYFFRNITWTGNTVYTAEQLNEILKIKKGDVYDMVTMEKRLYGDPKQMERDIRSLYTNRGYLFFNIVPVEVRIEADSVDVEMRIMEGKPAVFNDIVISGNTVTNERVIRRQLYTRPGYLYSQVDLERSIREIAAMGHFDPEHAMDPSKGFSIMPNPMSNTVDVTFNVSEKNNSQFEVSGGWGGDTFVGTLGLSFNNFSIRRLFKKNAWTPVPLGDGQNLSLRFQTNGSYYTAFSLGFMEPWLYGKKPTSFNLSAYYTRQTDAYYFFQTSDNYMEVYGVAVGLGSKLKWPDNYFVLYNEFSWQSYRLHNWNYDFIFDTGKSINLSYKVTLSRNSMDQMLYPRSGSEFSISLQLTPPYSLFRDKNTDYKSMSDQEKYRWIEYHKWSFKGALYTQLIGDLVLMTRAQFGYLGYYNKNLGYSPFEGFKVGGDGMSGYTTYGSEIIALRGYPNYSLTPEENGIYQGHVYDKFTLELRYPLMLQPTTQIYALVFLEGGNCWSDIKDFNPFSIKRSAGIGVRFNLPMIGMLGVDWGWGFDPVAGKKQSGSNFHFMIGQQF